MSKESELLFHEVQYHGLDKPSLLRRLVLSVFCFVAYYWSENPKPVRISFLRIGEYPGDVRYGQLFFILGLALMVLSVILLFIPHMKIMVYPDRIVLISRFSASHVEFPLNQISSVKKVILTPSFFRRPSFNLLNRGKTRFYTRGNEVIEIKNTAGDIYRIGSQRCDELLRIVKREISAKNS